MTKVFVNPKHLNRDEFLTPFDRIFDQLIDKTFPTFKEETGVSFSQGAYPKVNVYEYEDQVLIISGDKHGFDTDGGKCITRELKQSSFKRSFNLGEYLDGDNISASFKDGMLSISIPKKEPEKPKKKFVKIS